VSSGASARDRVDVKAERDQRGSSASAPGLHWRLGNSPSSHRTSGRCRAARCTTRRGLASRRAVSGVASTAGDATISAVRRGSRAIGRQVDNRFLLIVRAATRPGELSRAALQGRTARPGNGRSPPGRAAVRPGARPTESGRCRPGAASQRPAGPSGSRNELRLNLVSRS